jgi:hypothetical protein
MSRINGIYLVRFGFRMWEILILKWFLLLKIQINSRKNQVLEGKISWGRGRVHTWANSTGHTRLVDIDNDEPLKNNRWEHNERGKSVLQRGAQVNRVWSKYWHNLNRPHSRWYRQHLSSNSCCKKLSRVCLHAARAFASSLRHRFSVWVRTFLTSAHDFFRFVWEVGSEDFGGFSFLDELTSVAGIFSSGNWIPDCSHTRFVCGRRS